MQAEIDCTRNAANVPTRTSPNELDVIANCVASQEWQVDFARVYAARESCTSGQAGRAASILCGSLSLLSPLEAVAMVLADDDLLTALRMATREAREDSRSAAPHGSG